MFFGFCYFLHNHFTIFHWSIIALECHASFFSTTKRIIYISDKKTESINLDKILNYEMIKDWVKIYRNTWTTREYWFLWDWRLFAVYMQNLLQNSTNSRNKQKQTKKVCFFCNLNFEKSTSVSIMRKIMNLYSRDLNVIIRQNQKSIHKVSIVKSYQLY